MGEGPLPRRVRGRMKGMIRDARLGWRAMDFLLEGGAIKSFPKAVACRPSKTFCALGQTP